MFRAEVRVCNVVDEKDVIAIQEQAADDDGKNTE
jgi:hypothetical protein